MSHFHRKPIVVPTDFSPASLQAIRTAQSIADVDSDINVVYVGINSELASPYEWVEPLPDDYVDRQTQRLQDWLAENSLEDVNAFVRCGDPGTEVCRLAEELKSPLIVVPSHGRSGLTRILLGSVAERIIRHADCSVLVLRRHDDENTAAEAEAWCPRKRVVVPVDFSESTDMGINVAKEIVDNLEDINVLNVAPHSEDMLVGSEVLTDEVRCSNRKESLDRFLAEHGHSDVQGEVITGEAGMEICDYVRRVGADTVVIASHGYHGLHRLVLGSTAERVVRHSSVPVLVLRRHDAE